MLTLLLGTDWTANSDAVLNRIAADVAKKRPGVILMVPELISHDTERRLCAAAGDTASRYAEVLTFTRLAQRVADAAGFGAPACLDNGGRLVAMASATRQLHSKLKAYAAVETRPEFLTSLLDAVDEFKRCCISTADLLAASKETEGSFAQKLEELSLILEAYDAVCAQGKQDPRDLMTWLLEQLETSDFAAEHIFYVDGFPDFTRQHTAILQHLIAQSADVVISVNCDCVDSENTAFEKAGATAGELLRIAKQCGVETKIVIVEPKAEAIKPCLPTLFGGKIYNTENLTVCRAESVCQDCHAAAEKVIALVQSGCRYRDISIVCTDMTGYGKILNMVFDRYHIPVYISGTENILNKTVIVTVLTAVDAAVDGFDQADVLRYLKSPLSPLTVDQCDRIENYLLKWGIRGKQLVDTWTYHPGGLTNDWSDEDTKLLAELNRMRELAILPLFRMDKAMKKATSLSQLIDALYNFLNEIQMDKRLEQLASQLSQAGDLRNSQILSQLWDILLNALEQLADMLGDTHWDAATFTRLLKLLLSQYDVGTIPAVLDAVSVGPISAMRCQQPEHLILLGANEGLFPAYCGSAGVLSDQERTALRALGVPLTGGAMEGLQAEFSEIYGVLCGAKSSVYVSCSGQASYLYRRLLEMAGREELANPLGIATTNDMEAGALLARSSDAGSANSLNLTDSYREMKTKADHKLGHISADGVKKLYGSTLKLSASQVDKQAVCRMGYFLHYGLRLQERKPVSVDPAEFGTYVHTVLEETCREIRKKGGFRQVSLAETLEIADKHSKHYIQEHFSQIDSQRMNYIFQRNTQELALVVSELWDEMQESEFEPVAFELGFGDDKELAPVMVKGQNMKARMRGCVDRLDTWQQNGLTYYRVVDYKTGKKDFDYCDVYNGYGLQMLLYLFTLQENGKKYLGENPVPAGVQYFPARAPYIPTDGKIDETEAEKLRGSTWKRKGLLLHDEAVLAAMEPAPKPVRMPYTRKKDGTLSGDLANSQQMKLLKGYIFALLGKMVDDIASGDIEPNPYTRGTSYNACTYCPYGTICHNMNIPGRRNYASVKADKFWEDVEKEMSKDG